MWPQSPKRCYVLSTIVFVTFALSCAIVSLQKKKKKRKVFEHHVWYLVENAQFGTPHNVI